MGLEAGCAFLFLGAMARLVTPLALYIGQGKSSIFGTLGTSKSGGGCRPVLPVPSTEPTSTRRPHQGHERTWC